MYKLLFWFLDSIQMQEKLHQSLVKATVKLEEQKLEQEAQEEKVQRDLELYHLYM